MSNPPGENAENVRPESKAERMEKRAENTLRNDAKPEDREALKNQELEQKTKEEKIRATSPEAAAALAKRGEKVVGDATNAYGFSPELIETKKSGKVKTVLPGRTPEDVQDLKQAEIEGKIQVPFNPDLPVGKSTSQPEVTDSANVLGEARSIGQTLEGIQKSLTTTLEEFKQEAIKSGAPPEMFESSSAEQIAFAGFGNHKLFPPQVEHPKAEHPELKHPKDAHKPDLEHGAPISKPPVHEAPNHDVQRPSPKPDHAHGASIHKSPETPDRDHGASKHKPPSQHHESGSLPPKAESPETGVLIHEPGHSISEEEKDPDTEIPEGTVIMGGAGGAPPPGGDGHELQHNYDPEYGTTDEFARQHRLDPTAPTGDKEGKEALSEKKNEKGKEKEPEQSAELKAVMEKLEQKLLEKDLVKDGKISEKDGKEAVDIIRTTLRPYTDDINGKNIAFAVVEIEGKQRIVIGISSRNTPGAQVPDDPLLKIKGHGNIYRETDSEFKILNQVLKDLKESGLPSDTHGKIAIFSEQKPCDSCEPIIKTQVPQQLKDMKFTNIQPPGEATWIYENRDQRLAANRRKGQ